MESPYKITNFISAIFMVITITILILAVFFIRNSTPVGWFSRTIVINNFTAAEIRLVEITAYTSSSEETDNTPFVTASQLRVKEGIIACPRDIPFGSKVEIEGKKYECQDRMNLKFNNRFDIWMPSKKEARKWGNQIKEVVIYARKP